MASPPARGACSSHHENEGRHVIYTDAHVEFQNSPFVAVSPDGSPRVEANSNAFLLPVDDSDPPPAGAKPAVKDDAKTGAKASDVKADKQGFVSLFDGKSLDGWEGNPKLWSVKDGVITGQTTKETPTKGNTFLIYKGGQPADFELRLKVRYQGGNTGVQYRSHRVESKENDWVVGGYQADLGGGKNHNGKLYEERGRGALANIGETVTVHADGKKEVVKTDADAVKVSEGIKDNEWFDYAIVAKGNHLVHRINGHTIIDCTDEQKDKAAASGLIAIQIHAGGPMTVQVKDVQAQGGEVAAIRRRPVPAGREARCGICEKTG